MDKALFNDVLQVKAPCLITTPEKQCLFYHGEGKLLLRERRNEDWEEGKVIKLQVDKFTAALDTSLTPHLIALCRGDLYHLTGPVDKTDRFSEQLIFRAEEKSCRNLLLAGDSRGGLHLLNSTTDPSTDRWSLLHHYFDGQQWLEPRVVDFGGAAAGNTACLIADPSGDLHLVYEIGEGDNTRLYYRLFDLPTLTWHRAFPISAYGRSGFPNMVFDRQQNLHLVWSSLQDQKHYVYYRQLSAGGWPTGGWKEIEPISTPLDTPPFPLIYYRNERIIAGWFSESETALWQYEHTGKGWEETTGGQKIPDYVLIRSAHPLDWEFSQAVIWILGRGTLGDMELVEGTAFPNSSWDPYFKQLDTYSRHLVQQAVEQTDAKMQLERALKAKQKEMFWVSQHSQRKIESLSQSLQQKDGELQKLENQFQHTIDSLKQKTDQFRRQWAEEKKRYQQQISRLEKEGKELQQMLLEKENTITKNGAHVQELKLCISKLQEENHMLGRKREQSSSGFKEWLVKIFQNRI